MKMWHVADKADSEYSARNVNWSGGYVVLAESAEAAVAMVETERDREFRESHPNGDDNKKRWYFRGVHADKKPWPPDYDVRPLPAVYSIPFLGYSW